MFLYGSTESYVEGNYVHHTWADHIHHTNGARQSWVWNNFIFNDQVSKGDDGVACVTYGPTSTRCADMEWWRNTHLGTGWGRGYAVIGGDDINIHHNWAIGVAGAGLIVASEPGLRQRQQRPHHARQQLRLPLCPHHRASRHPGQRAEHSGASRSTPSR